MAEKGCHLFNIFKYKKIIGMIKKVYNMGNTQKI